MILELESWLSTITGFAATSCNPTVVPRENMQDCLPSVLIMQPKENPPHVMLIPISAHGTNPASAVMAGMKVVVVKSDEEGHIDIHRSERKSRTI